MQYLRFQRNKTQKQNENDTKSRTCEIATKTKYATNVGAAAVERELRSCGWQPHSDAQLNDMGLTNCFIAPSNDEKPKLTGGNARDVENRQIIHENN